MADLISTVVGKDKAEKEEAEIECLGPLKIHMLKLNHQRDGMWKWELWEVIRS